MKFLSVFICLIALLACTSNNNPKREFESFSNNFPFIHFPFTLNDHIALRSWELDKLIDTNFVTQFELVKPYADKVNPKKNISDYKCTYVGKCDGKNYTVFIYKMFTSEDLSGQPKMILSTYSKEGKKVDEIIALWNDENTKIYNERVILNIADNRKFDIKSIKTNLGYLNGRKVERNIKVKIMPCEMDKDGKIIRLREIENDILKDDNPKIKDEIQSSYE